MALSSPRIVFGVHSFTPYKRTTGEFYGTLKVLKGSSLSLAGEQVELFGGSAKYPWAVEDGTINSEMSLKPAEYPDFLFELFLGKAPTANSAEATGNVSTLTNKKGTSLQSATTGIASVSALAGSEADLKLGKFIVKAASSTTVDVYLSSDIDLNRGTDGSYQNDLLKITASPLTITASADTNIPNFGLKLTGGSGVIGMTTGDTAEFSVRPINSKSMTVRIGGTTDEFPEFGAIVMAQKRGNQEMFEIDCFRCKGIGMPLNFEMGAFSEAEIKLKVFYDAEKNGVFDLRHVSPS